MMTNIRKTIFAIALIPIIMLTACSNDNDSENKITHDQFNTFELSSNTIHKNEIYNYNTTTPIENNDNTEELQKDDIHDYNKTLELVTLQGSDNSEYYEFDEYNNIVYNGMTFHNLYDAVKKADSKYDWQTLLNFIIKTYKYGKKDTWVYFESNEVDDEGFSVDVEDNLYGIEEYENAKRQYNEPVQWMITLLSDDGYYNYIYGCHSYILITDSGNNITINMDEYNGE